MENKFVKFNPDIHDPGKQCKIVHPHGQCNYLVEPGFEFCPRHLGKSLTSSEDKKVRNYRLEKWRQRVNDFADSPEVKSLREEIGITRLVLENIVNKCQTDVDLYLNSQKIQDAVKTLQRLIESCHKLEKSTGFLLDKTQILNIAGIIINIVGENVKDENVVEKISDQILIEVANVSPTEEPTS